MNIKSKTKNVILIAVCSFIYVCLQILLMILNRTPYNIYNGVIMAFSYGLCLIMIKGNQKAGVVASLILSGINLFTLARALVFTRTTTAIPGVANCVFYIVTIIILYNIGKQRELDTITDLLTGLLNRRGVYAFLKRKIEDEKKFDVIYLELDNFKVINDNYGHSYGDKLLIKVANLLKDIVGKNGSIARVGGYEFVVVLSDGINADQTADYLLSSIRERISIDTENSVIDSYLTCYAGIASYPKDARDYESLIKCADIAMYHAASEKSAVACFFDSEMAANLKRELDVENLIKDGLEKDFFFLVYQPQFDIKTKELRGFETLLRLKDTNDNLVSPGEFIPIAEKGELILKIDDYVLDRAMREFKPIVEQNPNLTISINVSAKNIGGLDFTNKLTQIIERNQFPCKNLEIEITEYCMVQSIDTTMGIVRQLRNLGIMVALDDFGTGYTSLNYLSKMPINLLKIDKSLIDDIEMDNRRLDFVNAVISLGHLMGCEVIAEGIEKETQLELLRSKNLDFVQGFVWGKPMGYYDAKKLALNE